MKSTSFKALTIKLNLHIEEAKIFILMELFNGKESFKIIGNYCKYDNFIN